MQLGTRTRWRKVHFEKMMKVLLIYPEFPTTYWSYHYALKFIGKKAALPPLGLLTVAALLPEDWEIRLTDMNATRLRQRDLEWADAVVFGTPTRFGNMCGQMRNFLDQTGGLWAAGKLVGKVGSVFASTATQHGGQETTITSFHTTLFHHGMVVVGVPYSCKGLTNMDEISGGTPYGATTLANGDGSRQPSNNELEIARFQGQHVAEITARLTAN